MQWGRLGGGECRSWVRNKLASEKKQTGWRGALTRRSTSDEGEGARLGEAERVENSIQSSWIEALAAKLSTIQSRCGEGPRCRVLLVVSPRRPKHYGTVARLSTALVRLHGNRGGGL
jgi:hypothetical protein